MRDLEHPRVLPLVHGAEAKLAHRRGERPLPVVVEVDAPHDHHAAPGEELTQLCGVGAGEQGLRIDRDFGTHARSEIDDLEHWESSCFRGLTTSTCERTERAPSSPTASSEFSRRLRPR